MEFRTAQSQASTQLTTKNNIAKPSDSPKTDEKSLEKPRPPSETSTSAVKPPYSYIALSNYPRLQSRCTCAND